MSSGSGCKKNKCPSVECTGECYNMLGLLTWMSDLVACCDEPLGSMTRILDRVSNYLLLKIDSTVPTETLQPARLMDFVNYC